MSFMHPHSEVTRRRVMEEFEQTWRTYSSPTRAAHEIGRKHGVSKTTVFDWMRDEGKWPTTRASRVLELEAQLMALKEENRILRQRLGEED